MQQIREFVDERQKAWCIHCGSWLAQMETTRDHVPTKAFLQEPYPANLPVVTVCVACNRGFSKDEEYFVGFLGSTLVGSTDPQAQTIPAARRILEKNVKLRGRIERSKRSYDIDGETHLIWPPENDRVERVIVKNARGHAFFEYGEPMLEAPSYYRCEPLVAFSPAERADFESAGSGGLAVWPEVGSRMMSRVVSGYDLRGPWVIVQQGVYRYAVAQAGAGLLVRIVIAEYLAAEVCWGDD